MCVCFVPCEWFSIRNTIPECLKLEKNNNVILCLKLEKPRVSCCATMSYNILICGFFGGEKKGLAEILHQKFSDADIEERHHAYLKPFRILVSLLDKPEIGNVRSAVTGVPGVGGGGAQPVKNPPLDNQLRS